MASGTILEDIDEEFLQCTICMCQLKEPKILPCLHKYCRDCLAETVTGKDHDIECPTCREIYPLPPNGVDGFKTDFNTTNIIEFVQLRISVKEEPARTCVACERKLKANAYCFKCRDFLCDSCHEFHATNTIVKDHRLHLFPLSEMNSRSLTVKKLVSLKEAPRCHNHPEKLAELCCTSCDNQPICIACTYGAHRGHALQEVTSLAKLERERLAKKMAELAGYEEDISSKQQELKKNIEDLERNVKEKKAEIERQFGARDNETEQKIKDKDVTLAKRKIELEETLKRKISGGKQELQKQIKDAQEKYDRVCREERATFDAELNNLLQENEKDKAKLHRQAEVMNRELKNLLSSLQKEGAENSKKIRDMLDHFDDTRERFENIKATASSVLVAKDDWTDVQCIGAICAAIDPLIAEVGRYLPEVELFSRVAVGKLLSSASKVNNTEREESMVHIEGVKGCNMSVLSITGSRDDDCVVVTGKVHGRGKSRITVINMGENKVKQTIIEAGPEWRLCDFLSKFRIATTSYPYEVGVFDIRDHTYRKRDIRDVIRNFAYSVATDVTSKRIIVGCLSDRNVHVFDDELKFVKKLTLPPVIEWPRDLTVLGGDLLVCDSQGSRAYMVTMRGESVCVVKHELPGPDADGRDWTPWNGCTDKAGFIYVLWRAFSSGQNRSKIVQYSHDGSQRLQEILVACDDPISCMTTVGTGRGEKIVMATLQTGELITYGLIEGWGMYRHLSFPPFDDNISG